VHLWVETVVILIKTVSSQRIFENIKFHENPSSTKLMFNVDGQTDRQEEAEW